MIEALRDDLNTAARPTYFVHPSPTFVTARFRALRSFTPQRRYFVELSRTKALVEVGCRCLLTKHAPYYTTDCSHLIRDSD